MRIREGVEGEDVGRGLGEQVRGLVEAAGQLLDHTGVLIPDRLGVGVREDHSHERGDEPVRGLRHLRQQIAPEMGPASLR